MGRRVIAPGFDCSGLPSWAYARIGTSVPHFTGAISNAFPRVPSGQLAPGDPVFFRPDLGHMGTCIGGGEYVNAPQTGDVVKASGLAGRSDHRGPSALR
ncbi:C40 family peptidase [Miltoncostaea marina]|uniref:C40 family peptidase n=1 Tax=Miltoncostaea marina TaxID=2843215 RepID=UPI001C3C312D|nr:NlpC/P60 family protein [Miltoncostaea marina]